MLRLMVTVNYELQSLFALLLAYEKRLIQERLPLGLTCQIKVSCSINFKVPLHI